MDLDTDGLNEDNMNETEKVVQVEVIDTNKNDDETSQETDGKGELRVKMKELRKILKTARKELQTMRTKCEETIQKVTGKRCHFGTCSGYNN